VDRAMDALSSSDEMPADVFCNQRRWVSYQCSKFWYRKNSNWFKNTDSKF
jgi:hypothetical protein